MNKVLEECALVKLKSLELSLKLAFNLEILFPEISRDYPDFGYPKNWSEILDPEISIGIRR